jgi:hypothetical protein
MLLKRHEAYCQLLGRPFARHLRVFNRFVTPGMTVRLSVRVNAGERCGH